MERRKLTDKFIKSLKPAADGKPYDVPDTTVPQMRIRVMGEASNVVLTFVLLARFPPSTNPTRRALGAYREPPKVAPAAEPTGEELLLVDVLTLAEARLKAQEWLKLIGRGIDPAIDRERRKSAVIEKQKNDFESVFEDWVQDKLAGERSGKIAERDVRREFLPSLKQRPITDITDLDILSIINVRKRKKPTQARNELGHMKRFFQWAIDQRVYGITVNPCAGLKPAKIIGKKNKRKRILSDDELFALWRATSLLPYPYQHVYRLLMLSALRLNEVCDAEWSEFDPAVRHMLRADEPADWSALKPERLAWIIPAARMKGTEEEALPHLVPLTPDILRVLESMPRFAGEFAFTTTAGEKAVWVGSLTKRDIDAQMLLTLKDLALQRGEDPASVKLERWVNHDIRRTVRTNLSRMRITEEAREAVMAHKRQGIAAVYDVHDYRDEKREALELWAARLRSIVDPPAADNVVKLQARA